MTTTKTQQEAAAEAERKTRVQLRALEAVQAALDRRDNGGDAATATDN
jgi:hypothetical protein